MHKTFSNHQQTSIGESGRFWHVDKAATVSEDRPALLLSKLLK